MKLQLQIEIPRPETEIEHTHRIMTLGSCFAANMGNKFTLYRFTVSNNSFGTLYNPVSIKQGLELLIKNKQVTENDLITYNDYWHSPYHHTAFSHEDVHRCLNTVNSQVTDSRMFLQSADCIIITFGTSFVYRYKKNSTIVANCHKIPASFFSKELLTQQQIDDNIKTTAKLINHFNKNCRIIFTLSPVRYWPVQAIENQFSKAMLLLSIHNACSESKNITYFPAYELMTDELRDYRFYAKDLVHPNDLAIDYIWDKFSTHYCSDQCKAVFSHMEQLNKARNHKPFDRESRKHKEFKLDQIRFLDRMKALYPYIDFSEDYNYFS